MDWVGTLFSLCAFIMREVALFAAFGFLFLGAGDLAVDFIWLGLRAGRRFSRAPRAGCAATLAAAARPGRFAVFIPAWDEAAVIGAMLDHARTAFGAADYLLYVGCYPNDPATVAAVRRVSSERIRLVVGPVGIR